MVNDSTIYFGIIGQTTGWIAIGFDPDSQMLNADIIFAWVASNGDVVFFDAFSRNQVGPDHPADTDIGGTFDLLTYNATEDASKTSIEFSRLLSTGDSFDNQIPNVGSIDVIWAMGSTDSFSEYHGGSRGTTSITFVSSGDTSTTTADTTQETQTTQTTTSTTSAASSLGFELIFMVGGMVSIIWFFRRKK